MFFHQAEDRETLPRRLAGCAAAPVLQPRPRPRPAAGSSDRRSVQSQPETSQSAGAVYCKHDKNTEKILWSVVSSANIYIITIDHLPGSHAIRMLSIAGRHLSVTSRPKQLPHVRWLVSALETHYRVLAFRIADKVKSLFGDSSISRWNGMPSSLRTSFLTSRGLIQGARSISGCSTIISCHAISDQQKRRG